MPGSYVILKVDRIKCKDLKGVISNYTAKSAFVTEMSDSQGLVMWLASSEL